MDFIWQPVMFNDEWEKFPNGSKLLLDEDWITPLLIDRADQGTRYDQVKYKIDRGAQKWKGADAFMWPLSDDNILPKTCLERIASRMQGQTKKVVVVSHKRGQRTVFHPHFDLIAHYGSMQAGLVSGEQYWLHFSLMPETCYVNDTHFLHCGFLMEYMLATYPNEFLFLPDIFVPFNALEPGRWDRDKLIEIIESKEIAAMLPRKDHIALLKSLPSGTVGAELGVFEGDLSALMIEIVKPSKLYLVDVFNGMGWSADHFGNNNHGVDMKVQKPLIEARFANDPVSVVESCSIAWLKTMPAESVDWVYIDSVHTFEHCSAELNECLRVIRSGGFICGHDYDDYHGVKKAVDPFCAAHGLAIELFPDDVPTSFKILKT